METPTNLKAACWNAPIDPAAAHRRAGGRRRHNAERRRIRDARRATVAALLLATERPCGVEYGWPSAVARTLGVHYSTIVRDLDAIRPTLALPDPCCLRHADFRARQAAQERDNELLIARVLARVLRRHG